MGIAKPQDLRAADLCHLFELNLGSKPIRSSAASASDLIPDIGDIYWFVRDGPRADVARQRATSF